MFEKDLSMRRIGEGCQAERKACTEEEENSHIRGTDSSNLTEWLSEEQRLERETETEHFRLRSVGVGLSAVGSHCRRVM